MPVLFVLAVIAVLISITAACTVGVVVLARRTRQPGGSPTLKYLGIAVLLLFGLAGAGGIGCTAFAVLAG